MRNTRNEVLLANFFIEIGSAINLSNVKEPKLTFHQKNDEENIREDWESVGKILSKYIKTNHYIVV